LEDENVEFFAEQVVDDAFFGVHVLPPKGESSLYNFFCGFLGSGDSFFTDVLKRVFLLFD
jgi:hypothetical protein